MGRLDDPEVARRLALAEAATEAATLMAIALSELPADTDETYRRFLLASVDRWFAQYAETVTRQSETLVEELRRPAPDALRFLPSLSVLVPEHGFGVVPAVEQAHIERFLKENRLASGAPQQAVEVHSALSWQIASIARRSPASAIDAAARLWAFTLLLDHDRPEVAALWARVDLRIPALQTSDMTASARQILHVARLAVPTRRGLSLEAPLEIIVDLTDSVTRSPEGTQQLET